MSITPGLLLARLLGAQEKQRQTEDDPQPRDVQREVSRETPTLSNDHTKGSTSIDCSIGLSDQLRSRGCIPTCPHSSGQSAVSAVHIPGASFSVDSPPVWNFHISVVIHQNYQTCQDVSSSEANQVRFLHRRLHHGTPLPMEVTSTERFHSPSTPPVRMANQCQEVGLDSNQTPHFHRGSVLDRSRPTSGPSRQSRGNQTEGTNCSNTAAQTSPVANPSRPLDVSTGFNPDREVAVTTNSDFTSSVSATGCYESSNSPSAASSSTSGVVASRIECLQRSLFDRLRTKSSPVRRRITSRLGSSSSESVSLRAVVTRPSKMAHQQSRVRGGHLGYSTLAPSFDSCQSNDPVRQHDSSLVHQQTGIDTLTESSQPDLSPVCSNEEHSVRHQSKTHTGSQERLGRFSVSSAETVPDRVDATPRSFQDVVQPTRHPKRGPLRNSPEPSTSSVCFPSPGPCSLAVGRTSNILGGTQRLCVSPYGSFASGTSKDQQHQEASASFGRALLASEGLVCKPTQHRRATNSTSSRLAKLTKKSIKQTTARETISLLSSRVECLQRSLRAKGYSKRAAMAVSQAHRQSTKSLYDDKWKSFQTFCSSKRWDPMLVTTPQVADFVVHLRQRRHLAGSTIATYIAAVNSVLAMARGKEATRSPEIFAIIRGYRLEDQKKKFRPPAWDLNILLDHLREAPYEPLEQASFENLTIKACFLVALATAARISEIHALDVTRITFDQHRHGHAHLGLAWDFIAKNQQPGQPDRQFHIPPLSQIVGSEDDQELLLCPVRALRRYIQVAATRRGNRQRLFIPVTNSTKGEVSRNSVSYWLKKAILAAYAHKGLPPPATYNPHEIRAVASTMALHSNISIQTIMEGCFWTSNTVFASHYLRNVSVQDVKGSSSFGPLVVAQQLSTHRRA